MKLSISKTIEYRIFLLSFAILASSVNTFAQEWKQVGSDLIGVEEWGMFGLNVSLNNDGKILAVGSPRAAPNGHIHAGSVSIFKREADNWVQLGESILGKDKGETLGGCVRLSGDGLTVAMGPENDDSSPVRVYTYLSGEWTQLGADIDVVSAHSWIRNNLSLSSDAKTLVIGFPSDTGFVRVFKFISGIWKQQGGDIFGATGGKFGHAVSISDDGSVLAVGAPRSDENGEEAGKVSVFKFISGEWTQLGLDILGDAAGDQSGSSVELSVDGSILAVGAPRNDANGFDSGKVSVYKYSLGDWIQLGEDIAGASAIDKAGNPVSLSNDGSMVAFGSSTNDQNGTDAGLMRVYEFDSDEWIQVGTSIVGDSNDELGSYIAISGDGSMVVAGMPLWLKDSVKNGHVRVFELDTLSSIDETSFGDFFVFPNPVSDVLNISFNDMPTYELKIMTSDGKIQYIVKAIREKKKEIKTTNWPQGIYFVWVKSNNKMAIKTVNVVH